MKEKRPRPFVLQLFRLRDRIQNTGVENSPVGVYRPEGEVIFGDFNVEKTINPIVAGGEKRASPVNVVHAQLAAGACDEILHAMLRFGPLVEMIVP
jgi:hypothetical protein